MTAQLIHGMSREDYDALEGHNFSRLKHILKSPAHYQNALKNPPEDTAAMALGRVVHQIVLEPYAPIAFAVWDGERRQGKEYEAFCKANKGKDILKTKEFAQAKRMEDAVFSKPSARALLSNGHPEVTLTWESNGLMFKGRPDWVGDSIVDLKTTNDASADGFGRQCAQMRYHMQAAMYGHGHFLATEMRLPCHIIAVENDEPFDVVVYRVPDGILEEGRRLYLKAVERLDGCLLNDTWPGADNGHENVELSLPDWALAEGFWSFTQYKQKEQ